MNFFRVPYSAAFCLAASFAALTPAAAQQQQYVISTVAGGPPELSLTGPTPGVDLSIGGATRVITDAAGNIYFNVASGVLKLDQKGIVTQVAGTSRIGYSGDGGPAASAQLLYPSDLTLDTAGNLYIADSGRIRRVAPSGIIATIAGNGTMGNSGDGGPAVNAQFRYLEGIAVDGAGNVFVADSGNNSVRKISSAGIITTIAGNGTEGFSGDGGAATNAQLDTPIGLALDRAGNLYIADYNNFRIRKVSPDGVITTLAGNGAYGYSGDGIDATKAEFLGPQGLALDSSGNLYIADEDWNSGQSAIRKVTVDGIIATAAGTAGLWGAVGVTPDSAGNLIVVDTYGLRICKVSPDGTVTMIVGKAATGASPVDGVPATNVPLSQTWGITLDASGNPLIAESGRVTKVTPDGTLHTVANQGGNAITEDAAGDIFVAGLAINEVYTSGTVSKVLGPGGFGTPGTGGNGLAVDSGGNLLVGSGYVVSKISPSRVVTTVAGGGKDSGDGGLAIDAQLNNVTGLLLDGSGNLLLSETYGNRVRKVSPDGIITTVAGTGTPGIGGDGGPATNAQLNGPMGLALDGVGNLYIAETYSNRVRMVSPDGIISTIAGNQSVRGYSGDGGPASSAQLDYPWGVAVDRSGNVYVADTFNSGVRILESAHSSVLISSIVDGASQRTNSVSPGKIVLISGAGLGPTQLVQNQASNGLISTSIGGTTVSFNGIAAPVLSASSTQVAAVVPYGINGVTAQVVVAYHGQTSNSATVSVAPSAPSIFTTNQTGGGQIAATNAVDGTANSAANPAKAGAFISFYATGEGQTSPGGLDGKVNDSVPPKPLLPVNVTVGGIPAPVQYSGGAPGQVAGLMQVNVQIPNGVQPGGYVSVVLQVGDSSTPSDAVWIAVAGN